MRNSSSNLYKCTYILGVEWWLGAVRARRGAAAVAEGTGWMTNSRGPRRRLVARGDEGEAGEAWSGAGVGQPDGVDWCSSSPPSSCVWIWGWIWGGRRQGIYRSEPFSPGLWMEPGLKTLSLVPVPTTNRDYRPLPYVHWASLQSQFVAGTGTKGLCLCPEPAFSPGSWLEPGLKASVSAQVFSRGSWFLPFFYLGVFLLYLNFKEYLLNGK